MLRPKQIVPLYNSTRAWLAAGPCKSPSADEGHEEESKDVNPTRARREKLILHRAAFRISNESHCNSVPEKINPFEKSLPNVHKLSLTCDVSQKAHVLHGNIVNGFADIKTHNKVSESGCKGDMGSSSSSCTQGNVKKPISTSGVHDEISREEIKNGDGKQEHLDCHDNVTKVGRTTVKRLSDIQNSVKANERTTAIVADNEQSFTSNISNQKERENSDVKEPHLIHQKPSESNRLSTNSGLKDEGEYFKSCEHDEPQSQNSNVLNLLNNGLNSLKLGGEVVVAQTTFNVKSSTFLGSCKEVTRPLVLPSQIEQCHDMTSASNDFTGANNLLENSECDSTLHKFSRRGERRRGSKWKANTFNCSRQGKARHKSHNDGRAIVERVCNILEKLGWGLDTEVALSCLSKKLSPYHVNEVLKSLDDSSVALIFFKWVRNQGGYKHDVHTYTTMVGILGRARKFDAVCELMEDMARDGCKPSVVTFNRLIHCYGRANQMVEALEIFHHMKLVGCIPDKVTYCTLIDLHAKAGSLDVAMDMYKQMQQAGLQPDTFTYSVIINCLGKAGELSAAQKILNEMIAKGCIPNVVTYNILIDLHAKSANYDMALKLYNDMQKAGFVPDQVTYSIVMEVLGHIGHLEEVENVFCDMKKAGWAPDTTVYGLLVDIWGKAGNLEKACGWFNIMLDSGVRPNVPTCNSLLGAYLRENLYDNVRKLLYDMKAQGMVPSLQTYTLLLSSYTMSGRTASDGENVWNIMASMGHPAHFFLCSLPGSNKRDTKDRIIRFFETISCNEQESKRSFTDAAISFLHNVNMKAEAAAVWEVASEKQIYPKAVTQKAAKYWAINLHTMSIGTAVIALSRTLSDLKEGMLATGVVPERIDIITGWGRRSRVTGSSLIKQAVEEILKAVSSPFRVESRNSGCFVGIGHPLAVWLYESDMDQMHLI